MNKPIVDKKEIRLAILGASPNNGHPYSWSAIFNGYNREKMAQECPYPVIPIYLNKQPPETLSVPNARVTHICCTGHGDFSAEHVAACSNIPHVVEKPEEVIGQVDAVLVATDIGSEHVERCRPFVEAGVPLFIDKPLVDNAEDLATFDQWVADGHPLMSCSSNRYAKEFMPYRLSTHNLGELQAVTMTMAKLWETYGIHALETIYTILGPGFLVCRNTGDKDRNIVHFTHRSGADAVVIVRKSMGGSSGLLTIMGSDGYAAIKSMDSFWGFKAQLVAFVDYLRTGVHPFPYSETRELMQMIIAGIKSRENDGASVFVHPRSEAG